MTEGRCTVCGHRGFVGDKCSTLHRTTEGVTTCSGQFAVPYASCVAEPDHLHERCVAAGYNGIGHALDSLGIKPGPQPSSVTLDVVRQVLDRDSHGQRKYGVTLDRTDLSLSQWLQHMAEELMDGAHYALAAKREDRRPVETLNLCTARMAEVAQYHTVAWSHGVRALEAELRKELAK